MFRIMAGVQRFLNESSEKQACLSVKICQELPGGRHSRVPKPIIPLGE